MPPDSTSKAITTVVLLQVRGHRAPPAGDPRGGLAGVPRAFRGGTGGSGRRRPPVPRNQRLRGVLKTFVDDGPSLEREESRRVQRVGWFMPLAMFSCRAGPTSTSGMVAPHPGSRVRSFLLRLRLVARGRRTATSAIPRPQGAPGAPCTATSRPCIIMAS